MKCYRLLMMCGLSLLNAREVFTPTRNYLRFRKHHVNDARNVFQAHQQESYVPFFNSQQPVTGQVAIQAPQIQATQESEQARCNWKIGYLQSQVDQLSLDLKQVQQMATEEQSRADKLHDYVQNLERENKDLLKQIGDQKSTNSLKELESNDLVCRNKMLIIENQKTRAELEKITQQYREVMSVVEQNASEYAQLKNRVKERESELHDFKEFVATTDNQIKKESEKKRDLEVQLSNTEKQLKDLTTDKQKTHSELETITANNSVLDEKVPEGSSEHI